MEEKLVIVNAVLRPGNGADEEKLELGSVRVDVKGFFQGYLWRIISELSLEASPKIKKTSQGRRLV